MRHRSVRCAIAAFLVLPLFLLVSPRVVRAQSESGSAAIVGVAHDQAGAVAPGVTITARHIATGTARTGVSDGEGRFTLPALPVGTYLVEATLQGFQTVRYENVQLTVGKTESLLFTLMPGAITESVVVTAEVAPLDRTEGAWALSSCSGPSRICPCAAGSSPSSSMLTPAVVQDRIASAS